MSAGSGQAEIPHETQVPPRARWKYTDKATELHRNHGYSRYAIDFATPEAGMHHAELSKEHRCLRRSSVSPGPNWLISR